MKNEEMKEKEIRKCWMAPEVEVLDGRKTHNATYPGGCEGPFSEGCDEEDGGS